MNWWGGVMFAESQPRQQICTEEYTGRWNERAEERAPGPKRTSHALVLGTTGGRRSVVRWKLLEASFHVGFPCSYEGRPHSCWAAGWCEITGAPLWEAGESRVCRPGSTAGRNPGERVPKRLWVGELFASQVLFCFMEPPSPGYLEDLRGLDPGLTQRTRNPGDLDCSKAPTSWESYPTPRHLIHTGEPLTAPGI